MVVISCCTANIRVMPTFFVQDENQLVSSDNARIPQGNQLISRQPKFLANGLRLHHCAERPPFSFSFLLPQLPLAL